MQIYSARTRVILVALEWSLSSADTVSQTKKSESWVVFWKVQDRWQHVSASAVSSTQTGRRTRTKRHCTLPRTWCATGAERSPTTTKIEDCDVDDRSRRVSRQWKDSPRTLPVKDWMHETAPLTLDPPADRQPMQLEEARRDMSARTQLENQASSGGLHALQRCDRREW